MKAKVVARWEKEESVTGDACNERTGNREVSHLAKMLQHTHYIIHLLTHHELGCCTDFALAYSAIQKRHKGSFLHSSLTFSLSKLLLPTGKSKGKAVSVTGLNRS
jgi:hypothetical protein